MLCLLILKFENQYVPGDAKKRGVNKEDLFLRFLLQSHFRLSSSLYRVKGGDSLNDTELNQIIADVLDGNTEQFEKIMEIYQKPIFLYCYHMLGNYAEAEENAQEVFLKTFSTLKKYTQYQMDFGAWVYKIAYHQCIDIIRKRKLVKYLPFFYQDEKENNEVDLHIEANYFDESVHRYHGKIIGGRA